MEKQLSNLYQKIINSSSNKAEDNVKSDISSVLSLIDDSDDWEKEYLTTNGPCDIISFSNKTIIETKKRGRINVDKDKCQLLKYLKGVAPIYDNELWNEGSSKVWRGILTDGRQWTCWDYDSERRTLQEVSRPEVIKDAELIHDYLQKRIYERWKGIEKIKIPSKTNLLEKHFKPIFKRITNTVATEQLESKIGYATKLGVWRIVLKGAGVIPDEPGSLEADIFWRHSFIVSVCRMIINHLDKPTISKEKLLKIIDNGFHAWLLENKKTKKIMLELASEIQKYQWTFYSQDVLKFLYQALILEEQRKEFGEFYTPDCLAKDVVEQVLDDRWLDQSIERAYDLIRGKSTCDAHLGVLDPSCGSGTFLLQSARYIKNRIRKKHRDKLLYSPRIIARLVHGIDVHPIAVEMSKATLRTVLTESLNPNEYRICLGSSLNEREKEGLFIEIKTPKSSIEIPKYLYDHPKFPKIVSKINHAIVSNSNSVSFNCLEEAIEKQAVALYGELKEVIREEGNHVWEWLILNNIYLNKLFKNGVGRIVGNPPWLVQNNAQESIRKRLYKQIAKEEGVYTRTGGYLANVDLAAAFTARTIRLYLPKMGGGIWLGVAQESNNWSSLGKVA